MRSCEVYINKVKAGILTETDERDYVFTYDAEYIKNPDSDGISLTMPVRSEPYVSSYLFPFFYNMLSEGANRRFQSRYLHIDEDDDFGIMLETCLYDTAGAVTVKPIAN